MQKRKTGLEDTKELVKSGAKKFVRVEEGAKLYSVGRHTFREIAQDAGAIYRVKRMVLVKVEILDETICNDLRFVVLWIYLYTMDWKISMATGFTAYKWRSSNELYHSFRRNGCTQRNFFSLLLHE